MSILKLLLRTQQRGWSDYSAVKSTCFLPEDSGSIARTYIVAHNFLSLQCRGGFDTFFWPLQIPGTKVLTNTPGDKELIHIKLNQN